MDLLKGDYMKTTFEFPEPDDKNKNTQRNKNPQDSTKGRPVHDASYYTPIGGSLPQAKNQNN